MQKKLSEYWPLVWETLERLRRTMALPSTTPLSSWVSRTGSGTVG